MTDSAAPADKSAADKPKLTQRDAVERALATPPKRSTGSIKLGGKKLDYKVEGAFVPVLNGSQTEKRGEPEAAVFTTAYQLERKSGDARPRPVLFAFNGGPGSASIWLQLGALGPKRLRIGNDGSMLPPPYEVEDNPLSWFEHFDLVFVDPPHTGYSLTASDDARKKMLSVDGDVACLTEVIRTWLSRHQRWTSPIYLAGESYGTTRGAAMADKLAEQGVSLAGLILISCAMDLQSIVFEARNDLPYALFLPAFAGVGQYHGCLKGPQAKSAAAARALATEFVESDYLRVLHRGANATHDERAKAAKRIAELTGLSPALVEHRNLRISDNTFFTELLRDRGQIVGRLEARVAGPMGLARTHEWDFDPGMESLVGPYTMAGMGYFIGTLGFDPTWNYEVLSIDTNKHWNWGRGENPQGNSFCCTSPDLSRALRRNPHLRVLVASGHFDLGTPSTASDWSLAQLDIPADVRQRVTHKYYDAGHMMYTRDEDLAQLKTDSRHGSLDEGDNAPMKPPKRLQPLVDEGLIDTVVRQLMSGKEAMVFVVRSGEETICAKVYKEATNRSFRQAVDYTENRKVKNSRQARAAAKGTKYGREKQEEAWQNAEVDALYRLAGAGVRVPKPINFHDGVLLMELVTNADGDAAPRLNDCDFTPEDARRHHATLVKEAVRMLCAGVVHGDLSEFNILLAEDGPVIIDLPQAVDAAGNNHAQRMLMRDVGNLAAFFGRFAPELRATEYGAEIWSLYVAGALTVETPLTGRYEHQRGEVDLRAVMREIEDTREEEAERQRRMAGD